MLSDDEGHVVDTCDMFDLGEYKDTIMEVVCPYCNYVHSENEEHGICVQCGRKLPQV